MTANDYRGEVEIELGGETRLARVRFQEIRKIERTLGRSIYVLSQEALHRQMPLTDMANVVQIALAKGGKDDLTMEAVAEHLLSGKGMFVNFNDVCLVILGTALGLSNADQDGGDKEDENADAAGN